ncbi:glycosyltransferase family 2 protein, partial [Helicobacter japonicus]
MQPKVAIIVPIYNVEKYLAACLDSIIHQSYKNLSIILIDDGSNDKSTEIAKEYFDKDYRITLICKSNGGQSSARNMGLEYISNGFTFTPIIEVEQDLESHRLPTFVFKATLKPNALSANNINYLTGEPLECIMGGGYKKSLSLSIPFKPIDYSINSCIIFSHTQTPPNDIEFLHFVDSDDMITPDCIATCMEHIGENDIVWHDTIHLAEDGIIPDDEWHKNLLDFLGLDEEDIRTPLPTIKLWKNLEKFHWVWGGVFRKKLCEKLRFSAQIRAQDTLFGMILFAKAQSTLLITQKLYIYRLRANSTVDLAFSKSE